MFGSADTHLGKGIIFAPKLCLQSLKAFGKIVTETFIY